MVKLEVAVVMVVVMMIMINPPLKVVPGGGFDIYEKIGKIFLLFPNDVSLTFM